NPADAAWTADADRFAKAVDLWPALGSLDVLCGLGRYAVLVIGSDKGLLSAPRKKGTRITFLKAYAEKNIKIQKWDTDARSPTFGKPLVYRVTPSRVDTTGSRTIQD
ncbi:hypothetical protein VJI72_08005, partial [Parvimonas micra]|nr:hypothetical protein [Parvimonas micra]